MNAERRYKVSGKEWGCIATVLLVICVLLTVLYLWADGG